MPPATDICFRRKIKKSDIEGIREILTATAFFYPEEIEIAIELALDNLNYQEESHYSFLFADAGGILAGYTCFGNIPCTFGSYDLYWIAVNPAFQRRGIGEMMLYETEKVASKEGCRRMYIETSSRELYRPTQSFYLRCGYAQDAVLRDFYKPGDSKIIYVKALA